MNEPYEEHDFERDGITYHALKYPGKQHNNPPVVLIHGLLMGPRFFFYKQVEKIQENGDVYAINLAGHYPSTLPESFDGPIDEAFITRTVEHQLAFFNLDKKDVILIGHSTGALAALIYAIAKPAHIAGLGILSSEPHGREEGSGMYRLFQTLNRKYGALGNWLWSLIIKSNSFSFSVHKFLLSDVAHDKKRMFSYPGFDDWVAWSFEHNQYLSARQTGMWLRDLYEIHIEDRLDQITVPVLLVFSEKDPYMSPSAMETIKKALTSSVDVKTRLIPQSGHLYMFESSDEYESTLIPWINALSTPTGP